MKYDGMKAASVFFFFLLYLRLSADDLICTGKAGLPLKEGYLPPLSPSLSFIFSLPPFFSPSLLFGLYRDLHWRSTCRKPCLILCPPRRLLDSRMVS